RMFSEGPPRGVPAPRRERQRWSSARSPDRGASITTSVKMSKTRARMPPTTNTPAPIQTTIQLSRVRPTPAITDPISITVTASHEDARPPWLPRFSVCSDFWPSAMTNPSLPGYPGYRGEPVLDRRTIRPLAVLPDDSCALVGTVAVSGARTAYEGTGEVLSRPLLLAAPPG